MFSMLKEIFNSLKKGDVVIVNGSSPPIVGEVAQIDTENEVVHIKPLFGNIVNYSYKSTQKVDEETKKKYLKQKEEYKNYPELIRRLTLEVYPEERVHFEVTSLNKNVKVFIHYPEITITNANNKSHVIRDMYARFDIVCDSNNKWRLSNTSLLRSTYTIGELDAGYFHSHVNASRDSMGSWYGGICMGDTRIRKVQTMLNQQVDVQSYIDYLNLFKNWLSYEAIEGGPYHQISKIQGTYDSMSIISALNNNSLREIQTKFFKNFDIKIDLETNDLIKIKVKEEDLNEKILSICPKSFLVYKHPLTGVHYNPNSSRAEDIKHKIRSYTNAYSSQISRISFKGKPLQFKIYNDAEFLKENDLVPHPDIYKNISDLLNTLITNKYYNNDRISFK